MTWRAPPFAEDLLPPSHPHPFDGQAGNVGGATRGVGMTSAPGPGEKRPRKYHGWEGLKFSFCGKFESVCDKNFTNQSAPIFPLSLFPPRGRYILRRLHHLRLSMRSPLTTSFIAFRPRIDEMLELRSDPLVSVMEKAQVMWSFHDAY